MQPEAQLAQAPEEQQVQAQQQAQLLEQKQLEEVQRPQEQDPPPQEEALVHLVKQEAHSHLEEGCRHLQQLEWEGGHDREGQKTSS